MRIAANISGKADPRIVPEEIFVADIEPNLTDLSVSLLSHKSFYNRWYPVGNFPADLLHIIDGHWYDSNFNRLEFKQFLDNAAQISYPVAVKPNSSSYGGNGIYFAKDVDELKSYCHNKDNCIIQEKVEQHPFFASFHPSSLNTIRVYLYRSVKDHRLHILSMDLTVGRSGLNVNNETAGGIYSGITDEGYLVGYAVDKYGTRYERHPDTGETFDKAIPDIEGLKSFSLAVGEKILPITVIGLDLFYDKAGQWRMMEINTQSHSIRSAQYFGKPFFGEFTDEVIAYCQKNHWTLR
ncbi:sugar-transfer associated ATP-grasp domain-containing protein [Aliifodinibius sp. S!AR15-10]|uniref:sugar-transfer associated ATP-grasp domain-containing protein n=1 Tax=Aliifodinibius sp. S!AR15-10 TaxID=2950437 RepID=UPI00286FBF42|nr:sugar-transfer associated ATP-grasp domain-containing protein [Aliifodinibius sp. S!AR15-10]